MCRRDASNPPRTPRTCTSRTSCSSDTSLLCSSLMTRSRSVSRARASWSASRCASSASLHDHPPATAQPHIQYEMNQRRAARYKSCPPPPLFVPHTLFLSRSAIHLAGRQIPVPQLWDDGHLLRRTSSRSPCATCSLFSAAAAAAAARALASASLDLISTCLKARGIGR